MPKQPDGLTGPAAKQPQLPVPLDLPGIADIHTEAAPQSSCWTAAVTRPARKNGSATKPESQIWFR